MADSPADRLTEIGEAVNSGKIEGVIFGLVVLPLVELSYGIGNLISAIFGVFINPLDAFGDSLGNLVGSLIGGPATILDTAAQVTAQSFQSGPWAQWGPLTWSVGVASILAGAYLVTLYLKEEETSDWLPYSFTDLPFLGSDEDGGD